HVLEDQILRGKDPHARAELARKVARLWEEQLKDPREAADAWRRVLRMKQGDADAQAGLERAKAAMLTQPKPDPAVAVAEEPAEAEEEATEAQEEVTLTGVELVERAEALALKSEPLSLDDEGDDASGGAAAAGDSMGGDELAEALAAPEDTAAA